MKDDLFSRIEKAKQFLDKQISAPPDVAIILGTGLGDFAKRIVPEAAIPYEKIPNFPKPTIVSHRGQLLFGKIGTKRVAVMEGRFHYYEGYTLDQVTFPVRVLRALGAKTLIVSNASGGLNLKYKKGDLMIIEDQINWMGVNPLIGPNDDRLGIRFPDMIEPYSKRLIQLGEKVAKDKKISSHTGVYVGVSGPNLETRAEYRMFQKFADAIGMSTVPEVVVAVHAGFETFGVSVVTDLCDPDNLKPVNIQEIIETANHAGPKVIQLVEELIKRL